MESVNIFSSAEKDYSVGDPAIGSYVRQLLCPLDDKIRDVLRDMASLGDLPNLQIAVTDARHLEVLSALKRAKNAVEIGTLFGFSAYFITRGMASDGRLITIEKDPRFGSIAEENFVKLGIADRIDQRIGAAEDVLSEIEETGPFDFVFIDANKSSYPMYLKWAARNLQPGGVLVADNTFAWGHLLDSTPPAEIAVEIQAIRTFNYVLGRSPQFLTTILPTAEGLTVAVKR